MANTFDYKKYKGIQKTQLKSTNSRSMLIVESTLLTWFNLFVKVLFAMGDDLSYGLNTLGPLCLWQCYYYYYHYGYL